MDPVPRVLYYAPRYLVRSERFIWQQATAMPDVEIAALEVLPTAPEFPHPRMSVVRTRNRIARSLDYRAGKVARRVNLLTPGKLTPMEHLRLVRLMRRSDLAYTMFLWNAFDLVAPTRMAKTPLVVHAAGSDVTTAESQGSGHLAAVHTVLARSKLVLCGSSFLRDEVVRLGADPSKCEVHYLGIEIPAVQSSRESVSEVLQVAVISRLHPVKGVDRSLRAFAVALRDTPAVLRVVGDGPERESLENLATALRIADRVEFTGELEHQRVYEILDATDVLLQHNVTTPEGGREGLGGTLIEASAHGVPVIATRSGGVTEAVVDGETGFLVDEDDVDEMAKRLSELAADRELRRTMGAAGRRFVLRTHNADTQNARLVARLARLGAAAD